MTDINARAVVLDILLDVLEIGKLSHLVIREKLKEYNDISKQERSFITRMSEGTIEKCIELDYIINAFSKIKVKKMKPAIRNILRMSVYQIKYMNSVPDSAVCNEAVKLTAKRGYSGLKGFVNGILRNIIREPERWGCEDDNYSVKYSMPRWIVDMWIREYGKEKTESMLKASGRESRICIRRNVSKSERDEFLKLLDNDKVSYKCSDILDDVFYLWDIEKLNDMDTFNRGLFQVQDLSSVMSGLAASPEEGDICVDVCAAPGGKTIHLADMLHNTGCVYSRDISDEKVNMINENVERTGFSNIKLQVWDATYNDKLLYEKADIVMADLPCSGLGVMSRKSDIKYKVSKESIKELVHLQREILSVVSSYIKPGGTLVYSTCTVNKQENDENVKWILDNLPFESKSLKGRLPEELECETLEEGYIQIFTGDYGMDGFFVALFKKKQKEIED